MCIRDRVTGLGPVAVQAIVAGGVVRGMRAAVAALVAGVDRAGHAIVTVGGGACLAAVDGVTGLGPVAVQAIVAGGVVRRMRAAVAALVAGVDRAGHAIVTVGGGACLAAVDGVTGLGPVAVEAIVAGVWRVLATRRRVATIV